jgi:hypothetical protein
VAQKTRPQQELENGIFRHFQASNVAHGAVNVDSGVRIRNGHA